jgi:hypothetical protein
MLPSTQWLLSKAGTQKNPNVSINPCLRFHVGLKKKNHQWQKLSSNQCVRFTTSLTLACVEESFIASASVSLIMRVGPNTIPRLVGCSAGVVLWL